MACAHRESSRPAVTINILTDDILREIFAFCIIRPYGLYNGQMKEWQRLTHVCPRWRHIIFESPRYLDLQLDCSSTMPFRNNLSRWPAFPLNVRYFFPDGEDDLVAALEHPDRVRRMDLTIADPDNMDWEVFEVMNVPFPALTHLDFKGPEVDRPKDVFFLPRKFLGRSTPCLQHLHLKEVAFPELPTLLLSAPNLVSFKLGSMPECGSGHFSPEKMVRALAASTRLRILCITFFSSEFTSSAHAHGQRRPDLPVLTLLPALTEFKFVGDNEYLEDLVARIDAPQLDDVTIGYGGEEVQTFQLSQFIGRSANLAQFKRAELTIDLHRVCTKLSLPRDECHQDRLSLNIYAESNSQLPCTTHILGQLVPMLSSVGHLSVQEGNRYSKDFASWEWLPLFRPFRAVEALRVSRVLAGYIGCALEGIDEELVTEELPALHLLYLEDDRRIDGDREEVGSTERFLSLRQLSGRPVTVVNTQDEFENVLGERPLRAGVI